MKVRDLLGAVRSNMVFEVEYRTNNWEACRGPSNSYELDKAFGDREVDNWFPFSTPGSRICIDMVPREEEEEGDEVVRGIGVGTDIRIVKGADGKWHTMEGATEGDDETD